MASEERSRADGGDVVLLVCVECGREVQFEGGDDLPSELTCEKCGNQVFRRFDASANPDAVEQDFRDSTERDTDTTDPAGDAESGDLLNLNNP